MDPNTQPDPLPAPEPPAKEPSQDRDEIDRGKGHIAVLPKAARDQVGLMLIDGFTYKQIIQSLGDLGKDLKEAHIGTWKSHTFKTWYAQHLRIEALKSTREYAHEIVTEKAGLPVQDAGRTVAAGQLYELLLSFNPRAFAEALILKPELYLRLINTLSRLSEGEAACSHHRAQESLIQTKLRPDKPGTTKQVITAEAMDTLVRQAKLI